MCSFLISCVIIVSFNEFSIVLPGTDMKNVPSTLLKMHNECILNTNVEAIFQNNFFKLFSFLEVVFLLDLFYINCLPYMLVT